MAVALPELPDDRRAQRRGPGPVAVPGVPGDVTPVDRRSTEAGRRAASGRADLHGSAASAEVSHGGPGSSRAGGPADRNGHRPGAGPLTNGAANGTGAARAATPDPRQPDGSGRHGARAVHQGQGPVPPGSRPGPPPNRPVPPPQHSSGARPGQGAPPPRTAQPPQGTPPVQAPPDGRPAAPPQRGPNGVPAGRRPARPLGAPPVPQGIPPRGAPGRPQRNGVHRTGPARPPGRHGAPPPDDRPTTDLGRPVDEPETEAFEAAAPVAPVEPTPPVEPAEPVAPGEPADAEPARAPADAAPRRRRRTGESDQERPASTYRSQLPKGSRAPRTGRRRRPAFWKELPLLVVVALLLTFLIQTFLAKVYVIPSGSMETTLHGCTGCTNDRVLVDKVSYRFGEPRPGDVVVFRGPDSWGSEIEVDPPDSALLRGLQQFGSLIGLAPPNEKDFVKRVIAVGGQTVQCCDASNRVLVDGKPLEEPYIYYLPEAGRALQQAFGPFVVPRGYLWMMGDSRNNSSDSRATGHGPVPIDNVIGKAQFIVLPLARAASIDAVNPQAPAVGLAADVTTPVALGLLVALPLVWCRRLRALDDTDEFLRPRHRR